jgi:hypothetical protein
LAEDTARIVTTSEAVDSVVTLTAEQRAIAEAPPDARIIVNAPPGTGKTTVACGRIAWLLAHGVAPHRIWLVSFTRTAIRELRNRIRRMADDDSIVYGVRVTTLDSRAWTLVQGFAGTGAASLESGYAGTIGDAVSLICSGREEVEEFLEQMSHIVVDEAQDLLGDRATLLEEIIRRIPRSCGVTVLADDAQSIYGFTEDESTDISEGTLPTRLRKLTTEPFRETELTRVHRTNSPSLQRLFLDARSRLLRAIADQDSDCLGLMRVSIGESSAGAALHVRDDLPSDNALVLFRTRFEVLEASSYIGNVGRPHRIRMSGTPAALHPWIGIALSEPVGNRLSRAKFEERWPLVSSALGPLAPAIDDAWSEMLRHAGDGNVVVMDELRNILSRSRPPLEFVSGELGLSGPTLSTIHASKGREADDVRLMLPGSERFRGDEFEEARVLFVGATRARSRLTVGSGSSTQTQSLDGNGRRFHRVAARGVQRWRAQVEVGLEGDVDVISPVARAAFETSADVHDSQLWLSRHARTATHLRAWCGTEIDQYAFAVRPGADPGELLLARLSPYFNRDLFSVARRGWPESSLKPPQWIGPLLLLGVRTVVLSAHDPRETELHLPWRQSGIWLVPIVVGLPTVPFSRRNG